MKGKYGGTLNIWEKGESGNPKGRPRKLVPTMKVEGYTLAEINDVIQAMVGLTSDELDTVVKHKKSTVLEITIAQALQKSIKNGNLDSLETLLNRVYGKPKEKVDITSKDKSLNSSQALKIEIVKTLSKNEEETN